MKTTTWPVQIEKGTLSDIYKIKRIADQYKQELGFITTGKIKQAIENGFCHVADSVGGVVGFVIFYRRKDGWFTIYDIAVDRRFLRMGIGRMLVNSVPTPAQLKCTVENPANLFYKNLGFTLVETQQGKVRALNIWKRKYLYIMCKGSSRIFLDIPPYKYSMEYGTRHTETPYYQPFMVDIRWKNYDWQDYLHKLACWKPIFALVPDYESISQRKDLYQRIRDLKALNILQIGVCPKFADAVKDIPSFCTLCISIPSRYAGFLPDSKELSGRRLHLLGGSPQKQLKYIQNNPHLWVSSMDGNSFTVAAGYGRVYTENKWRGTNNSYAECIQISMKNVKDRFYNKIEYNEIEKI